MTLTWDTIRTRLLPALRPLGLEQPGALSVWLWPVVWSLWIAADAAFSPAPFFRLLLAVVLARAAALVVFFGRVNGAPRLSAAQSRLVALGVALAALALAAFSPLAVLLAACGAGLALLYLPLRRRSHLGELLLACAAAVPSLIAFAAQTGHLGRLAWLLFVLHVLWTSLQAISWAVTRRESDLKSGIGSAAILFDGAVPVVLWGISALLLLGLLFLGRELTMTSTYYPGLVAGALALIVHGWRARTGKSAIGSLSAAGALLTIAVLGLSGTA